MNNSRLPKDWVVMPALDAELKRYILLGYLQRVNERFSERKLYPYLDDLRSHLEELVQLKCGKNELAQGMPGQLIGFDPRTGEALHERDADDVLLELIEEVIDFSIPDLRRTLLLGQELKHELGERIQFSPVGIQPLHATEGWLLLRTGRDARVYAYTMPLFREHSEVDQYRSVITRFLTTYSVGIACTYENIKADLRAQHRDHPNPATFVLEAEVPLPLIETYMPLAKQLVYEFISSGRT